MEITSQTKIATLLKANPKALDAIVSINAHYKKLQNPLLRKILASRVSIADAAKVGGVTIETFFNKLLPLGFEIKAEQRIAKGKSKTNEKQPPYDLILDVRESLSNGNDPFNQIMDTLKKLKINQTLLLVNSFVPAPLINILEKKGFKAVYFEEEPELVKSYISKTASNKIMLQPKPSQKGTIEALKSAYGKKLKAINVKGLEMPAPMIKVLEELQNLPAGHALHVFHKKVPVYLLPELKDLGFEVIIEEKGENNVELIIYRKH